MNFVLNVFNLVKDCSGNDKVIMKKSLGEGLKYIENVPKIDRESIVHTGKSITRMNVIVNYIFQINNGLLQKKRTGQTKINFICPV
ncbi:hypothetical protein CMU14_02700 [Elizabethkingia anophelis]|nr:hypothetical protein [Elizabethkingia anophelis]